tara:strand:- start:1293 stop:1973 length:681 start_codon:yes stop_codon:yes gene_type:complete
MAKRMTDTDKWKKRFVRELSSEFKLLWLYILDDCNHAGIWEVDLEVASIRIGETLKFDIPAEDMLPQSFLDKIVIFDNGDKWFIPEFIDFQYGELNPNSNVHKSVILLLQKYNLEGYMKGTQTLPYTVQDKDIVIVKEKAKAKRFVKPTLDEVANYIQERKSFKIVDAEKFFDFYSSNGWRVGKNAMKDWKAAVRTWEKNSITEQTKSKVEQSLDTWQEARRMING